MRVNVYAEEMTDRVEIIAKEIDGQTYTGLRIYLELPATVPHPNSREPGFFPTTMQVKGPFIHREGDDDSSAITFWGKHSLREVLIKALEKLDDHFCRCGEAQVDRPCGRCLKASEEYEAMALRRIM